MYYERKCAEVFYDDSMDPEKFSFGQYFHPLHWLEINDILPTRFFNGSVTNINIIPI